MRLINADELIEVLNGEIKFCYDYKIDDNIKGLRRAIDVISNSETVRPIKQSEWIYYNGKTVCKRCRSEAPYSLSGSAAFLERTIHCPHCGARMYEID